MFKHNREVDEFTWTSPTWAELFDTIAEPAALLSYMLKVFLRAFAPQVRLLRTYSGARPQFDDRLRPADTMAVEPAPGPETVALYAACTLELFNHIIDYADYHECANERCKRTFVHQQSRSEKGNGEAVASCTARPRALERQHRESIAVGVDGRTNRGHWNGGRGPAPSATVPVSRTMGTLRSHTDRAGCFCLCRFAAHTRSASTRAETTRREPWNEESRQGPFGPPGAAGLRARAATDASGSRCRRCRSQVRRRRAWRAAPPLR
jgi:hypothetical protein